MVTIPTFLILFLELRYFLNDDFQRYDTHYLTIFFLCRLDHKFGGCACSGGGGGASVSWILHLQEKNLNLSESDGSYGLALTFKHYFGTYKVGMPSTSTTSN